MAAATAPVLEGDARRAVEHRGSHMQIIACAGSGKTEVVAQRVADLIASGTDPAGIIAFTFTERAAEELKARISARVDQRLGAGALDRLGAAFVGTIHAYCFRLLQQHVPSYETFDVLDERRLTAFLCREEPRLRLKDLTGKLFTSIGAFLKNLDVVENELLSLDDLGEPFRGKAREFYRLLDQFRLLTYGQLISRAIAELGNPVVAEAVHATLRHLIVDEYQDVNPAQEHLIELLAGPQVELCVVGDDDQAIYQWRGSDVGNIVNFSTRYPRVRTFSITQNRRSRPRIVQAAAAFARSIPGRLDKEMQPIHPPAEVEVVTWSAETEAQEADRIAETVRRLHDAGLPYRDVAVLVRGRVSYPALLGAFDAHGVPVQPAGRTGLFTRPEAQLFGKTYAWLAGHGWSPERYGWRTVPTNQEIFAGYGDLYDLDPVHDQAVRRRLLMLKASVDSADKPVNLVGDFYELLADLGAATWDADDPIVSSRLGTLARCSSILADYESVRRRSRPDPDEPGAQIGGQDRGQWYYNNLSIYITNYASGAYEDFDGEPDIQVDAVDLTTVHKAKGLEWRVVFVPSLTKNRFPSSKTGRPQDWLIPRHLFSAQRYEGSDADERRLFYVAMTRARDWLSLSRHERIKNQIAASPYHQEVTGHAVAPPLPLPGVERIIRDEEEPLTLTFSELAAYRSCGFGYRLSSMLGFQPFLAPELGYGKAVHHILRAVAEHTRATGCPPDDQQLDRMFDQGFFLPAASKPAHRQLKHSARRLVNRYLDGYQDDLHRVWETERPFELHLPTAIVSGRADVILDKEGGEVTALAIVDYKTSTDPDPEADAVYALQLAVYTDAGRREGLDVRAAYVHDLKAADRQPVDVSARAITSAEEQVEASVRGLRSRDFRAKPGRPCLRCDQKRLCPWDATAQQAVV
jgi:DNA helicase II / ATP-dependent DNA helicase PcrA